MDQWLLTFSAVLCALAVWQVLLPLFQRFLVSATGQRVMGAMTVFMAVECVLGLCAWLLWKYALADAVDPADIVLVCLVLGALVAGADYLRTERRLRERALR